MKKIVIFASGEGTNAENIIRYFKEHKTAEVTLLIYNRKEIGAPRRAEALGVPTAYVPKADFQEPEKVLPLLEKYGADVLVLAGFLLHVPQYLLDAYPRCILNIHPALLPKHGGKGMYGDRVHEAVVAAGEKESGITIHLIDANYDQGETLFQAKCPVLPEDSAHDVAQKVHKLEYAHFPKVIEEFCEGNK